ncbi:hypothetical protein H310_06641 [Aphanomyces invadans]|uniref:DDE Tnp4 domain-containing protein n=1 Tax=Aphanomyces invadans TaxID=157072 RepID=A0A024U461_9STRA|nr:hypothetical protein H310_06641 [Aphanomyces invadans]ETW01005.1 hypothetical protein H310_06641 [Aphanomyces invadans]|eukprot:XP_008870003.1 hypothetical protein H310_06641 [Aphanomyces invadans]
MSSKTMVPTETTSKMSGAFIFIFADKGYQGLLEHVRAVIPTKAKPRQHLSLDDERRNKRIASDRIMVEI